MEANFILENITECPNKGCYGKLQDKIRNGSEEKLRECPDCGADFMIWGTHNDIQ